MKYILNLNNRAFDAIINKTKRVEILLDLEKKKTITLNKLLPNWWN